MQETQHTQHEYYTYEYYFFVVSVLGFRTLQLGHYQGLLLHVFTMRYIKFRTRGCSLAYKK